LKGERGNCAHHVHYEDRRDVLCPLHTEERQERRRRRSFSFLTKCVQNKDRKSCFDSTCTVDVFFDQVVKPSLSKVPGEVVFTSVETGEKTRVNVAAVSLLKDVMES